MTTERDDPPLILERYWPITRDIAAFILGSFLLVWQTVFEESAQTLPMLIGFAALGTTASGVIQRWLLSRLESGK